MSQRHKMKSMPTAQHNIVPTYLVPSTHLPYTNFSFDKCVIVRWCLQFINAHFEASKMAAAAACSSKNTSSCVLLVPTALQALYSPQVELKGQQGKVARFCKMEMSKILYKSIMLNYIQF